MASSSSSVRLPARSSSICCGREGRAFSPQPGGSGVQCPWQQLRAEQRLLPAPHELTLWYSTASWVSPMILSTSSMDITCGEEPGSRCGRDPQGGSSSQAPQHCPSHSYLVHFVQTLVAYFQALDDLHFYLGELDVLDLEREGEREEIVTLWAGIGTVNLEGIEQMWGCGSWGQWWPWQCWRAPWAHRALPS